MLLTFFLKNIAYSSGHGKFCETDASILLYRLHQAIEFLRVVCSLCDDDCELKTPREIYLLIS